MYVYIYKIIHMTILQWKKKHISHNRNLEIWSYMFGFCTLAMLGITARKMRLRNHWNWKWGFGSSTCLMYHLFQIEIIFLCLNWLWWPYLCNFQKTNRVLSSQFFFACSKSQPLLNSKTVNWLLITMPR